VIYRSKHDMPQAILRVITDWADSRSKDPNTKVGAAVYDPVSGALFLGYNGFPQGMPDRTDWWDNRPMIDGKPDLTDMSGKYARVIHAERNAIRKAVMALGENINRCDLYLTHYPCRTCMLDWIINFGIERCWVASLYPEDPEATALAKECGIQVELI